MGVINKNCHQLHSRLELRVPLHKWKETKTDIHWILVRKHERNEWVECVLCENASIWIRMRLYKHTNMDYMNIALV